MQSSLPESPRSSDAAEAAGRGEVTPVSAAFTPALLALLARLKLQAQSLSDARLPGNRRSRQRGRSLDFADQRAYVAGDDPRDLDWNAFARFDTLLIRLFSAEVALPMDMLIDASASMRWQEPSTAASRRRGGDDGPQGPDLPKTIAALRAASALAYLAAHDEMPVRLVTTDGRGPELARLRGFRDFLRQVDDLAASEASLGRLPKLQEALRDLLQTRSRRTLVLFTDGYDMETLIPPLRQLRHRGVAVGVVLCLSSFELSPSLTGELQLRDAESGQECRVSAGDGRALQQYRERLERYLGAWRRECRRMGAGCGLLRCSEPLPDSIEATLRDAGLVR